jgi:hypothetical protein
MGYVRKKVAGNTTSTFNTKTGQTRYTTTNKVGNITNSSSHKGNSMRVTKTTKVNNVISRTSKSYTPPKMKAPTPAKVNTLKRRKHRSNPDFAIGSANAVIAALIIFFIILVFSAVS